VKLPDAHNVSVDASVTTLEECGARCMANCSCVAYAPMDIRGGGGAGSGCIMWTEDGWPRRSAPCGWRAGPLSEVCKI
jgi:hypothetical protein